LAAGEIDCAAATNEQASAESQAHGNYFCLPDIVRLRGEILLARSRDNAAAEEAFREALALAVKQSCRPLELRAATSLARLLAETGRREEARETLAPVYAAFTEGLGFPDLQAAKALLDGLK
jgi:predicted ATPase